MARLLVIIPSFNERENIRALIDALFVQQPREMDVLVVDDGSPDGTAAVVKEAQSAYPERLHLIVRQGKGGRGSAVLAGIAFGLARDYALFMEMDADFSHRPEEVKDLLAKVDACDCVVGSRYMRGSEIRGWGWRRSFFSRWANRYARLILRIPISDYTNGFRCYTRRAAEALDPSVIRAKGYVVLSEIAFQLHRKGMRFGEVPTLFVNRRRGVSNLSLGEIQEAFLSVIRIRFPWVAEHIEQGLKFGISGAAGAVVDLGSLTFFVQVLGISPEVGVFFSTSLALLCVFLMNKFMTFRHRSGKTSVQLVKFGIVYAIAIALNVGLSILFMRLGVHYFLAKVLAIGIVMFYNYAMLHSFVFAHQEE